MSNHRHVCSDCDRVWDCTKYDCCNDSENPIFLLCASCTQDAGLEELEELHENLEMSEEVYEYLSASLPHLGFFKERVTWSKERIRAMYHDTHKHMCLCCETVSDCMDEECEAIEEEIVLRTCCRCANHEQEQFPIVPSVLQSGGIHVHVCLLCDKEWDCSNECGCAEGSISEFTCSLCTDHLVSLEQKRKSDDQVSEISARDGIMHSHRCMIDNHMWEHDDFVCAMESMYDLECPACFVFVA